MRCSIGRVRNATDILRPPEVSRHHERADGPVDFCSSHQPDRPFTAGLYIKDGEAEDASFTDWPNCEWKYVIEGEWQ